MRSSVRGGRCPAQSICQEARFFAEPVLARRTRYAHESQSHDCRLTREIPSAKDHASEAQKQDPIWSLGLRHPRTSRAEVSRLLAHEGQESSLYLGPGAAASGGTGCPMSLSWRSEYYGATTAKQGEGTDRVSLSVRGSAGQHNFELLDNPIPGQPLGHSRAGAVEC